MTYQSTHRQEKPNLHRQVLEMSIDREKVVQVKVDKQRGENALKQMSQKHLTTIQLIQRFPR